MTVSGDEDLAPAVAWEDTDCLLCGSDGRSTLVEIADELAPGAAPRPAVVRCNACGLCYTSPRPTPATVHLLYPREYSPHQVRPPSEGARRRKRRGRGIEAAFRGRPGLPPKGDGRLLDFGCGGGKFLQQMHAQGWQVLGVDLSDRVVQQIQHRLQLPAVAGDLSSPELAGLSFDLVTMRQSLEHVHHPLEVLRQARRLLAPGGTLMVWVPNIDSLPFRWFGAAWYGLDLPRHLIHLTPATLRRMVAEAGFQADRLWMVPHSSWLKRSAIRAQGLGSRSLKSRCLAWRPVARLATRYAVLTRQADCIALSATKMGD